MKAIAYGPLALKPDEFWRLTLTELVGLLQGSAWRQRQSLELAAWVTANLMNATGNYRSRITIQKLLKPVVSEADKDAQFEELWRRLEKQRREN